MTLQKNDNNSHHTLNLLIACVAVIAWLLIGRNAGWAQTEEMQTITQVADLIQQLKGDDIANRDAAEAAMLKLPIDALDFIEIPYGNATTDLIDRLTRVRLALEKRAVERTLLPSKITLDGEYSIDQVLIQLQQQTGNHVQLHPDTNQAIGNQKITLNLIEGSFWEALNHVLKTGNLDIDPYGGEAGRMALRPAVQPIEMAGPNDPSPVLPTPPSDASGLLSIEVNRIGSSRNFRNPQLDFTTVDIKVRWEPRVTPISIELDTSLLKIIDENDQTITPSRKNNISSTVQPAINELDFPISMALIERDIKRFKKISGTFNAILPGRLETFTFRNLGELPEGIRQTKSGATVTWHGYVTNEELYALTVELSFDDTSNAIDSHLGWAYDNEVYLLRDGQRFESVASETVAQRGQHLTIQYLFEEDPEASDLVYRTPAAIVKVDMKFGLKDIDLP